MSLKISTYLSHYMMATGSLLAAFENSGTGSLLRFYSGDLPASADAAATGTLLLTVSKGGDGTGLVLTSDANATSVRKVTNDTWQGTIAESGIATYYRLVLHTSDDDSADTGYVYPRVQGVVGINPNDDFYMVNTTLTASQTKTVAAYTLQLPLTA